MNPWLVFGIVWVSLTVGFVVGSWWRSLFMEELPDEPCAECRRRTMRLVQYESECG